MATQLAVAEPTTASAPAFFTYDQNGESYRHWQVSIDGRIATVTMNVDPDGGLVPGYCKVDDLAGHLVREIIGVRGELHRVFCR
jgi:hypothetical protein